MNELGDLWPIRAPALGVCAAGNGELRAEGVAQPVGVVFEAGVDQPGLNELGREIPESLGEDELRTGNWIMPLTSVADQRTR